MDNLDRYLSELARGQSVDARGFRYLLDNVSGDPASETVFCVEPGAAMPALKSRLDFFRRTSHFCPEREVDVCGVPVRASIRLRELWRWYAPLCLLFADFVRNRPSGRTLVGIAGAPGSGKSVLAALLSELVTAYLADEGVRAVSCGMDGWHMTNRQLDETLVDVAGNGQRSLRQEKGSPRTFHVHAFVDALRELRDAGDVSLPVYDRSLHDPVPGGLTVERGHRVVFVEGNYLLLDRGPWYAVAPLLDLKVFATVPLQSLRGALVVRHVRGGRSVAEAKRHLEEVDVPNYETVMHTARRADMIIKRDARQRVVDVRWNDAGRCRGAERLLSSEDPDLIDEGEMQ